ncbi:MAG TPA: ABC transporter permease [Erysipelothrix sp.]|nr:ABC transporter permease [Erysipelothrix sp.]
MKPFKKLIWPYVVWLSMFIVVPMLLIVYYAFTNTDTHEVIGIQFTFDHFRNFFDPVFVKVLIRSLKMATITTFISLLIGYPLAYMISKMKEKTQTLMILLITIPMWINMLIRTYAWISLLSDKGLINTFLARFGIAPIRMMYTDFAVILGMVYNFLPFMILQIYNVLNRLDNSLIEASHDLGANRFETFGRIIFPLSLSGVISGITLVFLPAVSTFVIPQYLGGGGYVLIGNLIEKQFVDVGNWHFGSAISLIMAIVILLSMNLANTFDEENKKMKGA